MRGVSKLSHVLFIPAYNPAVTPVRAGFMQQSRLPTGVTDEEHTNGHEEEENGPAYDGTVIGGGVGFAIGGPLGAATGGAIGLLYDQYRSQEPDEQSPHNQALLDAATYMDAVAQDEAAAGSRLWLAHVDGLNHGLDAEDGGTGTQFEDISKEPDIIYHDVRGHTSNVVIEVETRSGIQNDQQHAAEQLEAFARPGYALALVMPSDEVAWAEEWTVERDDVDEDRVHVVAADAMGEFIAP